MKDYNLLTQNLLASGYTAENYPEYVRISGSRMSGNDPLYNLAGGFTYKSWCIDQFIYKTGCGRYVKGRNVLSDMGYMGVEWSHENDCPVIRCPYDIPDCPDNDKRLHGIQGGGLCIQCLCVCHRTMEEYDFENSIEKANQEREQEKERKYQEYENAHNHRVCREQSCFDERTRTWELRYEPSLCVRGVCRRGGGYCPILGKELTKKRVNVYYDLKTSGIRHDGTLFDGESWASIEKGIRFFEHPASLDICEAFIKVEPDTIFHKLKWEKLTYMQMFDKTYTMEVLNIRAEYRPGRDLMQDLQDIQSGIRISHASDNEKREKAAKRERRQTAKQIRISKLEKKLLEVGYMGLQTCSIDKIHADKWLSPERIEELEEMRQQQRKEEREKPVQLSLFDML